jgi:hypothetical protein
MQVNKKEISMIYYLAYHDKRQGTKKPFGWAIHVAEDNKVGFEQNPFIDGIEWFETEHDRCEAALEVIAQSDLRLKGYGILAANNIRVWPILPTKNPQPRTSFVVRPECTDVIVPPAAVRAKIDMEAHETIPELHLFATMHNMRLSSANGKNSNVYYLLPR